jgi:hypothetical protein
VSVLVCSGNLDEGKFRRAVGGNCQEQLVMTEQESALGQSSLRIENDFAWPTRLRNLAWERAVESICEPKPL